MKNKEAYDLTKMTFKPYYQTTGCGKKVEGKCWIDIIYEGNILVDKVEIKVAPMRYLLDWLEKEK